MRSPTPNVRAPRSRLLGPDVLPDPPRFPWSLSGPVTATLLGLAAVAAAVAALGLATGGWQVLPVLSPSMRPAFDAGAAVLAVRVPAGSVRAGDVIVYRAPIQDRRLVVHRVVRVVRAGARPVVLTGGDANDAPDPWLARLADDKVWKVRADVPHLGHVLLVLRRPPVRLAMLLAGIGVALTLALRAVWSAPGPPAHPAGRGGVAAGHPGAARGRRRDHPAGVGELRVDGDAAADDLQRDPAAADRDHGGERGLHPAAGGRG